MSPPFSLQADVGSWLRPNTFVGAIAYFVLFCALAALLSRALRLAIQAAVSHAPAEHVDRTATNFLRQLGVLLIWVFVLALYAHLIPDLRALGTAMLAGASVASIVLGLAAQTTLGNLVAGISILIYRPFRLGDLLQISAPTGTEIGTVEALSLGYTILGTQDGRRVIVPNSLAISQVAVNLNALAHERASLVSFWVARADVVRARTVALGFAQAIRAQQVACFVTKTETTAVQLSLSMRLKDREPPGSLAERLAEALGSEGIPMPQGKGAPTEQAQ
ncbi:MAG TPA: mechanosensitive ion channel domain-containing protein [Steroidobacteraceae bacterium]|nr:mechanosensitive ion channel domain-containing protein [Steroidobacteraceae bacterium]